MKPVYVLGLGIWFSVLVCSGALASPPGLSCAYHAKSHAWTLQAEGVPLPTLLTTLSARAGFELVGSPPEGPRLFLRYDRAPLEQIVWRILRPRQYNYALVYRRDRLQRLILLDSTPEQGSSAPPQGGAEEGGETPGDSGPGTSVEGLLGSTHHPDPERRRSAFQALAPLQGEAAVYQRLQEGLSDPDPEVREQVRAILGPGAAPPPPNPYPEQIPEGEEE